MQNLKRRSYLYTRPNDLTNDNETDERSLVRHDRMRSRSGIQVAFCDAPSESNQQIGAIMIRTGDRHESRDLSAQARAGLTYTRL